MLAFYFWYDEIIINMLNKILGFCFLAFGILVIFWGLWASYQIFNGNREVPEVFKAPEETAGKTNLTGTEVEEQMKQILGEQIGNLIPAGSTTKTLNLVSWSIFMFILIYAGGKISGIGIKLLVAKND